MTRHLVPIASLLLGTAFLFFAGGMNALLLPVRGTLEEFSPLSLGLLGTGYAAGYVLGCLYVPRLVQRVGHIRAFSVMAAMLACSVLMTLLVVIPAAWIGFRAVAGFAFAGAAMIVESWLGERTEPQDRGTVFGLYMMVHLAGNVTGQIALGLGEASGYFYFVLAAVFYVLALVPTAVSSSASPTPLVQSRLDLRELWRNSPIAVFSALAIGVANGSFGALGAVYALQAGMDLLAVSIFVSLPIVAGLVVQMPIGYVSDRVDRRKVLVGVAVIGALVSVLFAVSPDMGNWQRYSLIGLLGAAMYTMYPLILAHASDHAAEGRHIQTSGGLLLLFGVGSIVGPLFSGLVMGLYGANVLFAVMATTHIAMMLFAAWRIARRAPVREEDKSAFGMTPLMRNATPQTATLNPEVALQEVQDALSESAARDESAGAGAGPTSSV